MDFPQYRKRFDNKSYYKVISEQEMEEIQLIGNKIFHHYLKADKYFEKLLILEILEAKDERYSQIKPTDYEKIQAT